MATFDEFRSRFPSLREASDEEIMSRVVRLTGLPPEQVARDFGYELPESDFGRSMRAGWERYKGTFGHLGGALGFESAGEYGRRQDEAADFLSSTSAAPHTTDEIEFGHPDKGVLNWMGRQVAESLPYMGEVALATLVPETAPALVLARAGRAARIGDAAVRALTRRGLTQEAAEQAVTRGMARGVQGAAASYPSSVGTILSEQQEQAGEYDPASAGALGVPHAALNMFGLEGAFARRSILRNVPETRGALGVLERGARGALRTGVGEGIAEVAQGELERVGRYAVDPSVEFVGPQADFERRESFLGGFAVGSALGGPGAAVQRRSLLSNANPEIRPADQAGTPTMGEPQPQQLTLPGLEPGGPVQQGEEQAPPPTPAITPPGQMTLPGMEPAQPPAQQQAPEAGTEAPDLDAERDLVLEKYGRPEAVELGDGRSAVRWRGKTYYNQAAFIADVDKLVKAERGKQGMIVPLELAWARAMRTAAQRNEASTGNPQRVNITPGTFRSGDFVNLTGGATTVDEVIARTRHALAEAEPTEDGKGDFKRRRLLAAFLEELTGEPTPEPQPKPTEAPTAAIAPPTQAAARTETAAPPAPTAAPAQESAPAPAPRAGAKRAPAADTTPVELSDSIIAAAEAIVERAANATTQQRLTVTGIRDELQIKHKEARALVAELVKRGLIQKDDRGRLTPAAAVGSRAAGDVTITDAQGNQRVVDARSGEEKARRVVRAEKPAEKPPVEEKPAEKPEKVVRRKRRVVPTQPARAATNLGGEAAPRQRAELDDDSRNFAPIDEDIDTEQESAITAEDLAGMTVVDERGEEVDAGDLDLADDSDGDTTLDASEADLEEYRLDTSDMADDEDRGTKRSVGGVSSAGGSQGAVADKALRTTRAVELADRADELEQLAERQEARDQGRGGRFAKAAATAREKARKLREQAEKLLQEEAEHQRKLAEKRRKAEQKREKSAKSEPKQKATKSERAPKQTTQYDYGAPDPSPEQIAAARRDYSGLADKDEDYVRKAWHYFDAVESLRRAMGMSRAHLWAIAESRIYDEVLDRHKEAGTLGMEEMVNADIARSIREEAARIERDKQTPGTIEYKRQQREKQAQWERVGDALEQSALHDIQELLAELDKLHKDGRISDADMHAAEQALERGYLDFIEVAELILGSKNIKPPREIASALEAVNEPFVGEQAANEPTGADEVADLATGETVLERAKRIWDEAEFPGKPTFDELEPAARDRWIESVRNGHESLRDMDAALTPPSYSHGSDTNLIARLWQGVRITARHGSLEDLTDRNGGITEAISILDRMGLSRIFRRVDEIQVFTSVEGQGPQGFFQRQSSGKGTIGLNADLTTTGQGLGDTLVTVLHETAHAIDMLLPSNWGERMSTAGVFSQDPRMKFRSGWRSAMPIGEVAKEVFEFWRLSRKYQDNVANTPDGKGGVYPSLSKFHRKLVDELDYPLDQRWGLHDNPSVLQQEVFAQLFAMYLHSPDLVARHLPKSAAFIKESINEAKAQLQDQFGSQAQENSPGGPSLPWRRPGSARAGQEADGRGNRRGRAESQAGRTVNLSASASSLAGLPRGSLTMSDIEALLPKGEAAKPKGAANAKTRAQAAHDFLDQIPKASANPLRRIWDNLSNAAKKGMLSAAITEDLADMAAKFIPAVRDYVNAEKARLTIQTRHEAVVERILEQYDKLPQRERGTGAGTVNDFIYRSTTSGQWGYDPDAGDPNIAEDDRIKVNPEMAERFNKLSPAGQKLVRDVFQYGRDMLAAKKAAVRSVIDAEYDERLREAQTDEERQAIESERNFTHTNYNTLMRIQEVGPYAPLKRFGDYVVVARSQKYIEAGDQERAHLQSDAQHYSVHFAETFGEAKELAKRLEPFYAGGKVSAHAKEIARDTIYGATNELYTAFGQIRQLLKRTYAAEDELGTSETEKAALKKMSAMLSDLYLSSLSEASARTAELQRRNIAGADKDMMRALATQGRADAHFIATLSTFQATNEAMLAMKAQARESDDRATATRYLNEFLQRYADSMIYKPHRLENAIKRATSIWMLSTSPAYYFQQLTQTFMMSAPYMAGRHGYFRTLRTLQQAYHDVFEVVKAARVQERLDFSKLPADVRDAIQTLVARGKIDIGMDFDLGAWAVRGSSGFSAAWNRADGALRQFNEKIEGINRATAAIAAYRMERARGASHEAATNYAEKVVHVTHGSYDGFNTPRLLSTAFPGARVITQFRRFQIIQISMIARLFHNSMRGESPETRLAARRGLAFTLAHAAVMGGVKGLPIAAPVAFLAKVLFGDDDEPYDLELALRRAVGHGPMAELLARGVPAWMGVDVSGRIGMGQMLSILPFFDKSPTSRQGMESMIVSAAGPFIGGLLPRAGNGAELMLQGQYYKGLEQFLPSGLANAMRGARFATEGVTTRAGERLMSSEELGYADVVFQALGLPTTKLTERQWRQNVMFETTEFYKERQTEIRQRYVRAYNRNDVSEMSRLRREWMELQAGKARNGLKRQPLSDLLKAPREAAKRERQVIGGVQTTRSTAGLARELSGAR